MFSYMLNVNLLSMQATLHAIFIFSFNSLPMSPGGNHQCNFSSHACFFNFVSSLPHIDVIKKP